MKFSLRLLIALGAVLLLLLFTIQSPSQSVKLQLYGWPGRPFEAHVSIVIFVSFAAGLLAGVASRGGKRSASSGGAKSK